jgi:phosphoenolpyruvate---glycerone phosphotransferase subunit DhaL
MAEIDLAGLWGAIAQNAENDRTMLNQLDQSNGNAGDNYAANMELVARTLDRELQGGQGDAGAALMAAAEQLRQDGRGKTAPVYADGLANAAEQLRGHSGLQAGDLMPLLQGLLQGAQGSSGAVPQGQGGLLDALVPGVLGYLNAKQQGQSDTDALMSALAAAQGGTGGMGSTGDVLPNPPQSILGGLGGFVPGLPSPQQSGSLPVPWGEQGPANPGAAGVGSLLQGLLQGLLAQGGQQGTQQRRPDDPDWSGSIDI